MKVQNLEGPALVNQPYQSSFEVFVHICLRLLLSRPVGKLTAKWRPPKHERSLFAKGFQPPDHFAIVIKFAQSCNNSKTLIICFWLACVPRFPLWPIMLTFLSAPLWNSGWRAVLPSSLHLPLRECIQISLSNIRSSYVKNKSKQTSKGRDEEGCCTQRLQPALSTGPVLRHCGGFDYCF